MNTTEIARYAASTGPAAADRPAYDSSPNGLAFRAGLWARDAGITVYDAKQGRGYTVIINRQYRVNLAGKTPVITRI